MFVAHSITVVCVIGENEEKSSLSALSCLSAYLIKAVVERGFFTNSHSITRHSKHLSNFECAKNVASLNVVEIEVELCHIPVYKYEIVYIRSVVSSLVPVRRRHSMTSCHSVSFDLMLSPSCDCQQHQHGQETDL